MTDRSLEAELIEWLRARTPSHPALELPIGDDAAVVRLDGPCVVTSDMLMDGVDFRLDEVSPTLVGRKSLAVNLSDIAAMAATPVAAIVSLALPRRGALPLAKQLNEGILTLAAEFGVALAGGDTNSWDGPLAISITLLGTPRGPVLRRDGGRPGDRLLATGRFGGSILGRHLTFTPRVREAQVLNQRYRLSAGADVSDGLSLDVDRLARASGCGAVLDAARVPIADDARRLAESTQGLDALAHALGDGEDFELVLAAPPDEAARLLADQPLDVEVTEIGQLVETPGLWLDGLDGTRRPLVPRGYEHAGGPEEQC